MPLHPPPTIGVGLGLVKQDLSHSAVGHTATLTFAVLQNGSVTAQQMADRFQTAFNTRIAPLLDDQVTIEKPFVSRGDGGTAPSQALAAGATVPGTRAGITAVPPQVAALMRKYTGVGGKKNRGRNYFPWVLAIGDVDQAGTISAGVVTSLQTGFAGLRTDLPLVNIGMVIANKTLAIDPVTGRSYVTAITAGFTVTSVLCEQMVATQRRRLVRA